MWDPTGIMTAARDYVAYAGDWHRYSRMPGAEQQRFRDAYRVLDESAESTSIDPPNFYANAWGTWRILSQGPPRHLDIGSQTTLVGILSAETPVVFVDYRPLLARLSGLQSVCGDLLTLPFGDASLECLLKSGGAWLSPFYRAARRKVGR